jgi:endonuclease/exonuclease/phosphatase family metal-dependent hydrolase
VRIATFNILHGHSLDDDRVDVERLAAAVKRIDADVLGLQEVDRDQPRSANADLTAVAADAMGAVDSQFVAALAGTPGGTWMAATGEEQPGASYGIALLSRFPVTSWRVVRLPVLRSRVPVWFRGDRRPKVVADEPRVAVAAVLEGPAGPMTVATTHLSFVPGWNTVQLRRLVRALAGTREPLVLTGDLNLEPEQVRRITRLRPIAEGATFPAEEPARQLDHVLVRGPLHVSGPAEVPRLPLSDHRALVVPCELG